LLWWREMSPSIFSLKYSEDRFIWISILRRRITTRITLEIELKAPLKYACGCDALTQSLRLILMQLFS
jgi:hypothetical protein